MAPFLLNLPSDSDLWMFVSSAGGITAGRVSAEQALFPYETVDRLHQSHTHTGPITLVRVHRAAESEGPLDGRSDGRGASRSERGGTGPSSREILWEPLSPGAARDFRLQRSLYKNTTGNRLVFEEHNLDLQILYEQAWSSCDSFGIVRRVRLQNLGASTLRLEFLDGLRNVLPYGAPLSLYQTSSSLVDAYKRTDLDAETGLAIFSLTSRIVDRPEAAEVLRANVVWCHGLEVEAVALSPDAIAAFRVGRAVRTDREYLGRPGSYLVASRVVELSPHASLQWWVLADAGLDHGRIATLRRTLTEGREALGREIERALGASRDNLRRIVASADGLQETGRRETCVAHATNVLFNSMRGGIFARNHLVPREDFREFVAMRSRAVACRHAGFLEGDGAARGQLDGSAGDGAARGQLDGSAGDGAARSQLDGPARHAPEITVDALVRACAEIGDADLHRIALEYLPLYFGRRHGDPSRPWNRFELRMKRPDGSRALAFEGNWRDIFQNWEALGASFPRFLPSFVAKFVNASTVDGFNPYRMTREGFDWEVPDPGDPWSCIGYWGDHQIAYLLRFLEMLQKYEPGALGHLLGAEIFAYAEVPYRIRPYEQIVENPRATIAYDAVLAEQVRARVAAQGSDGALVRSENGGVYHATLLEKLLVPALSKISNFVPGGGIWMNTQRPEWNDANNALVGSGLSVVTLCYLQRYLRLLRNVLASQPGGACSVSVEVATWLRAVTGGLDGEADGPMALDGQADGTMARGNQADAAMTTDGQADGTMARDGHTDADRSRRSTLDLLGRAFCSYRRQVYARGFSGKLELTSAEVIHFCDAALVHLDHSIRVNRREDGLYHSYNLLDLSVPGTARIRRLGEMLEGQVAVLNSGVVGAEEAAEIVTQLFASALYSPGQRSFLLYPDRRLPSFLQRNLVPEDAALAIPLVSELLVRGEPSVVLRDERGDLRFHPDLERVADLERALDGLARQPEWAAAAGRDRAAVLALFDRVFGHSSYTGRSGAMYGYEGLGCVYWHMVSKLALAVQEQIYSAVEHREATPPSELGTAARHEATPPSELRAAARHEATPPSELGTAALPEATIDRLVTGYRRIRAGLGDARTARDYGAFPTDPYSHTPPHGGASQPGMTGQVKEEILVRLGELGVEVEDGCLAFRPILLQRSEFGTGGDADPDSDVQMARFEYFDVAGEARSLELPPSSLAFTFCQVPVVYERSTHAWVRITERDGRSTTQTGPRLERATSQAVFARDGRIVRIEVGVPVASQRNTVIRRVDSPSSVRRR